MSTGFAVPQRQVENLGKPRVRAAGRWEGTIEEVTMKPLPSTQEGEPFAGYATTDGEIVTVYLRENTPLDGQDELGGVEFADFILRDGEFTLYNVDTTDREFPHWQIRSSILRLASFAQALGWTESDADGNLQVQDGFVDALRGDTFKGFRVGYTITHRFGKDAKGRKDPDKVYPTLVNFFPATGE